MAVSASAEGGLHLELHWDGRRVRQAVIQSRRPLLASTLLAGRGVHEAVQLVPLLFSLCGRAQAVAAAQARDAALGIETAGESLRQRTMWVAGETIQEHCWRLLLDWPAQLGQPAAPQTLKIVRALLAEAAVTAGRLSAAARLEAVIAQEVIGVPLSEWVAENDPAAWQRWADTTDTTAARVLRALAATASDWGASTVAALPALDAGTLREELMPALLADADFPRHPSWRSEPRETGPLARMRGHPVIARLLAQEGNTVRVRVLARLAELAILTRRLSGLARGEAPPEGVHGLRVNAGTGLGWVETARGLLLHLMQVCAQKVVGYVIVAPTEWNFHPDGACARGLAGCAAADEDHLRRRAALMVMALDPCVAFDIRVCHA